MNSNFKTIFLRSHDAGEAEILAAFALENKDRCIFHYCVTGVAREIFTARLGEVNFENFRTLSAIRRHGALYLTGTTRGNLGRILDDLKLASSQGFRTAAFLDHWVNYRERFIHDDGSVVYPDEIWVGDADAMRIAREDLPEEKLKLVTNPYFERLKKFFDARRIGTTEKKPVKRRWLFVGEPLRTIARITLQSENLMGLTPEKYFQDFIRALKNKSEKIAEVTLRLHPREDDQKPYEKILSENKLPFSVRFSKNAELAEDILESDVVVAMESAALPIALLGGKRAVSCKPKNLGACRLPQKEILKITAWGEL